MNLSDLSFTELQSLHHQIVTVLKQQQAAEQAEAREKILELAKSYGLSLDDVLSNVAAVIARKPVAAKYRNPNDASQSWTGRGRKPVWMQDLLDEGFSLKDLAI